MRSSCPFHVTFVQLSLLVVVTLVGCQKETKENEFQSLIDDPSYEAAWNERNAEVYRYLIAQLDPPPGDKVYFLTVTPMSQWDDGWKSFPAEELARLRERADYRPAEEAHLKQGYVLEKGTEAPASMHWISVKKWLSETEVVVEDGIWQATLGGGASLVIYEKVNGRWQWKRTIDAWVS